MNDFPAFMKNPKNRINSDKHTSGIEGYCFEGADNSQMAYWICNESRDSDFHTTNSTNTWSASKANTR